MEVRAAGEALAGLLPQGIAQTCGFKRSFHAVQVFKWIARGVHDFAGMSDLPLYERERLTREYSPLKKTKVDDRIDSGDGTVKLRIALEDGAAVECVLLTDMRDRKTACLSTQAGCPMGCAFCKTGRLGYLRNLEPHEIVEQVIHLHLISGRPSNLVFMGMGEPLLNLENLRRAASVLCHKDGFAYSTRKITISTCGLVPQIMDLADAGPHLRLAVSLTVADDEIRDRLMPVNKTWNLAALKKSLVYYQEKTQDRITLELALLGGINSDRESARKLLDWIKGLDVQINVIPWNPVDGLPFKKPSQAELERFLAQLEGLGLEVTRRRERGASVSGACGQLGGLPHAPMVL